jgi:hypothetical protein
MSFSRLTEAIDALPEPPEIVLALPPEEILGFAPAILDAVWRERGDAEALLGALSVSGLSYAEEELQEAVHGCLLAIWRERLCTSGTGASLGSLLAGIGTVYDDLEPFLREWEDCPCAEALANLGAFVEHNGHTLLTRGRLAQEWVGRRTQHDQVVRWLRDGRAMSLVDRIAASGTGTESTGTVSETVGWLRTISR